MSTVRSTLGSPPGFCQARVGLAEGRAWYERLWGTALPKEKGLDTIGMLTRAAAGKMEVLFLVGADPLSDCPDKELAALALERARFVVAVDALPTASTAHADVVLPAAIYTERRGTFTNIEGRISWLGKKVTAPGTARPDWMIAVELARHLGGDLGAGSLEDLWAEIENVSLLHRGVSKALHESLSGRDGVVVPLGTDGGGAGRLEAPEPLDPMADPGIASADTHPVPPAAGNALVSALRRQRRAHGWSDRELPAHPTTEGAVKAACSSRQTGLAGVRRGLQPASRRRRRQ